MYLQEVISKIPNLEDQKRFNEELNINFLKKQEVDILELKQNTIIYYHPRIVFVEYNGEICASCKFPSGNFINNVQYTDDIEGVISIICQGQIENTILTIDLQKRNIYSKYIQNKPNYVYTLYNGIDLDEIFLDEKDAITYCNKMLDTEDCIWNDNEEIEINGEITDYSLFQTRILYPFKNKN